LSGGGGKTREIAAIELQEIEGEIEVFSREEKRKASIWGITRRLPKLAIAFPEE